MNHDLPMLYGWLFFGMLGAAVGYVIGWTRCNVSWRRHLAAKEAEQPAAIYHPSPERIRAAGQKAMREMRERNPGPIVTAEDVERARSMMPPSYSDEFSSVGAEPLRPASACSCEACLPMDWTKPETMRMIVCSECGNKRCPHATDHRNACTNSNEPGQKGSSWEHVKPAGATGADRG